MKSITGVMICILLFLTGCSTSAQVFAPANQFTPREEILNVFAAVSLVDAFTEIGKEFETAHPGMTVKLNFAGSQALRTQIEQGAPVDVFASANTKEMDTLTNQKLVHTNDVQIFLTNQLLVILPANNPADLQTLADLARPGIKLVLAAKEVPVGNYSLQVLARLDQRLGQGYQNRVLANVVSYENDVKQVVAKVKLGEADAGIVYSSDSVAAPDLQKIAIPQEDNIIAIYPIAPVTHSKNSELAQTFIDYVLSANGQKILNKWGFSPAQ